jgi:hypothetical protein
MTAKKKAATKKATGIDAILEERGKTHGDFKVHSNVTQNIKRAMHNSPNWEKLPDDMKEAMEMTAHKYGRILSGDFNVQDHWSDTCGYNRLVEKELG